MVISPKVRGFICTTAHPVGCQENVQQQIKIASQHPQNNGPKKVLVIGASTGYGLASRITAAFTYHAATIGVFFERPASGARTASAGWYNTAAFEKAAKQQGLYAKSINGDAFSDEIRKQTIALIKQDLQQVDLVIYSLASPRRTHPKTGETFNSVLKTLDQPFTSKSINPITGEVTEVTIEPGNQNDVANTVAVMGGEDWQLWMNDLLQAGVLAPNVKTVAYSYIGPEITFPIYREGTIGQAKKDLENTAVKLNKSLNTVKGQAFVSVNKALVTQSSAAIPIVPLYISILFKIMKQKNNHEDCILQMQRLFRDRLYHGDKVTTDEQGLIRLDDWEMQPDVQQAVIDIWHKVTSDNVDELTDLAGYRKDFYNLFGFEFDNINYEQDVDSDVAIESVKE